MRHKLIYILYAAIAGVLLVPKNAWGQWAGGKPTVSIHDYIDKMGASSSSTAEVRGEVFSVLREARYRDGEGQRFLKMQVITESGQDVATPVGYEAILVNLGESLHIDIFEEGLVTKCDHYRMTSVIRFWGKEGTEANSPPIVGDIITQSNPAGYYIHDIKFDVPGIYALVYSTRARDGDCRDNGKPRMVFCWVAVLPEYSGETNFSACYVGSDSQCPAGMGCDCEDGDPTAIPDYYHGICSDTNLDYQALMPSPSEDNTSYHWSMLPTGEDDFWHDAEALCKEGNPEQQESIYYRLQGPAREVYTECDGREGYYCEKITLRIRTDGIYSMPNEITITRNLAPDPKFSLVRECDDYKVSFYNETDLLGSNPETVSYIWHYGNGQRSGEIDDPSPSNSADNNAIGELEGDEGALHIYEYPIPAGEKGFTPTLQANYTYEGCPDSRIYSNQTTQVNPKSLVVTELSGDVEARTQSDVLSASAATLSSSRLMDLGRLPRGEGLLRDVPAFLNGQRGVWKGHSSFAYMEDRAGRYGDVDISTGGTFGLNLFDWSQSAGGDRWVKASQITGQDAFGQETESRDALGLYSAALYGYYGQLAIAVGANAKESELGFIGFEQPEYKEYNSDTRNQHGREGLFGLGYSGNISILYGASSQLKLVDVVGGSNELAILQLPYNKLEELRMKGKLSLSGSNIKGQPGGFILDGIRVDCKYPSPDNKEQSIISLGGIGLSILGEAWTGQISYYEDFAPSDINEETASVTDREAHTGRMSLHVKRVFSQEQRLLTLQEGKEYIISCWVKINKDIPVPTYKDRADYSGSRLGIKLSTEGGSYAFELLAEPSGTIIEGWQRIETAFTYGGNSSLILSLQPGENGEAFFDDIRIFPANGNMQSYVYEPETYRLKATLDNNNYATLYSYDGEGRLYLIRKETVRGIMTIQESMQYQAPPLQYQDRE